MIDLYKDYKFLTDYFTKGIKHIAPCILFWGNDIEAQYELALEIARILNCKNSADKNCNCLNCNWIRNNSHPAVLTYSKVDNKPSDDDSKTMFSISQARMIKNNLAVTSEYHRVLIFCDKNSDGKPEGLNYTNFSTDAANALLKTFEEPPVNTTFFFLTKDISDMISTVVSRSQCFFVPSKKDEPKNFELVEQIMDKNDPFEFYNNVLNLIKEYDPLIVLTQMQNYLVNLLKSNIQNNLLKNNLIEKINSVEKAKKELKLNMNVQTIIENLAFDFNKLI